MGTLEYDSNNSGGSWWLSDDDWLALEKAGWKINWFKDNTSGLFQSPDGRFLGALATSASVETDDPQAALDQWKQITGEDPEDEGCNCCGPPHSFSFTDNDGNYKYFNVEYGAISSGWS